MLVDSKTHTVWIVPGGYRNEVAMLIFQTCRPRASKPTAQRNGCQPATKTWTFCLGGTHVAFHWRLHPTRARSSIVQWTSVLSHRPQKKLHRHRQCAETVGPYSVLILCLQTADMYPCSGKLCSSLDDTVSVGEYCNKVLSTAEKVRKCMVPGTPATATAVKSRQCIGYDSLRPFH